MQVGGPLAKRFTDTGKWKRPWFRALPLHAKLLWIYLCDECDHAGIWIADLSLMSFQLGFKVTDEKLKEWLGDKIQRIDKDKYFIPSFFEFQYGSGDKSFKARDSALNRLTALNLVNEEGKVKDLPKTYLTLTGGSTDPYGIGNGKGIGNGNKKEGVSKFDFEAVYKEYPKKEGKQKGFDVCRREIKTIADFELLHEAVKRYNAHLAANKTDPKYIKHFSSFMAIWRDWSDSDAGETVAVIRASDYSGIQFTGPEGAI